MKAIWNDEVIAESDNTVVVEGNHYFPPESLARDCFTDSDKTTHCSWKGEARYYHVTVNGETNTSAAWYYPNPKEAAREITDHVAFWSGVQVTG